MTTEREDVQLMGRIAAGDREAFARLFDRHSPVVIGVLARMLGRREEAEEVAQEAFLQAWRQADRYSPRRATPRGWLLMLARSRALDRIRSRQARGRREEVVERHRDLAAAPVGTRNLEAEERRRLIGEALLQLDPEQRRCIELAFFDGLSHSQVARRLEAPLGTVKSRILYGMKKLRHEMAERRI